LRSWRSWFLGAGAPPTLRPDERKVLLVKAAHANDVGAGSSRRAPLLPLLPLQLLPPTLGVRGNEAHSLYRTYHVVGVISEVAT
jgi:hypothetical protein